MRPHSTNWRKHNNWSMSTDKGVNLLDPGSTPAENGQFMLFLMAVVKAVDEYQDLLRLTVTSAGNDHRLGANEAPPAIVSIYLGEELTEVIDALEHGVKYKGKTKQIMKLGVDTLPELPKDTTDRNRTSPFAFTGNKFEFRMLGSTFSIAGPNIIVNTIVADELRQFADELEKAKDFNAALHDLVVRTIKEHKRIIFNGNNYTEEWTKEAARRGLLNLKNSAEALPRFADKKNIELFERNKVFTEREVRSRMEIMLENYCKVLTIEGLTMIEMGRQEIYPAVNAYLLELCKVIEHKEKSALSAAAEKRVAKRLSEDNERMFVKADEIEVLLAEAKKREDAAEQAKFFADRVIPVMEDMRAFADDMEGYTAKKYWPFPTYADILFSV